MSGLNIADLAIWFPAFLLSITFHEAAHATTSRFLGDRTAEKQATLNPIPHIREQPIGTLVWPIVSFLFMGWCIGYAQAPYDPWWADRHPRRAALMSLAGPVSKASRRPTSQPEGARQRIPRSATGARPGYATATG